MNYNIRFQNVSVKHKIYVLCLCDHIQLKLVNIMHISIVAQVFLVSSIWHFFFFFFFFCISFHMSKFKTRIHSKSCTVTNALKKQDFHTGFISIHYYEKKHDSLYNSGTICGSFFNPTP